MLIKLYHLVLRVTVLVTLVVPLDLVVRVTLVVVFPLFVTFTVLRVTCAITFKFLMVNKNVLVSLLFNFAKFFRQFKELSTNSILFQER